VAAHLVKQETGFTVEYGPVRAADTGLPELTTPEMRLVRCPG
jgi:hypothetical protein